MPDQHIEDTVLLKRISHGDEDALAGLYHRHGGKLYAYALRILGDRVAAEDVIQESLLAVWQGARSFRGDGRVIAWLFSIVHNKAMRTFREKPSLPLEAAHEAGVFSSMPSNEPTSPAERAELLRSGLAQLSLEHRTVLDLVFYQGLSIKEAARVCSVPPGTIKSRLSYAKTALKGILTRENAAVEDLT